MTLMGFAKDTQKFDTKYRDQRNLETLEFFVRAFIGFTEFGRLF